MIIYLHGSAEKEMVEDHYVIVCPAGHVPGEFKSQDWWLDADMKIPKQFQVYFHYVEAEVEDNLGAYMIKYGMAHKHKMPERRRLVTSGIRR